MAFSTPDTAKRPLAAIALALLFIVLAAIGYGMLWTELPGYDDEGYILLSARAYSAQGHLYDQVYSQYGPAFYVLTDALQRVLGGPATHTFARAFTLILWLATAGACARIVARTTRAASLTILTGAATFLFLYFLPGEAFHPGTFAIFVLAGSLDAITGFIAAHRWRAAAITAGIAAALLVLTKVNVGVFYGIAIVAWGARHAVSAPWRRIATAATVPLFLVIAALLMKSLWAEAWVLTYLAVFGAGALTLALATSTEAPSPEPTTDSGQRPADGLQLAHAGWFLVAVLGVMAVVIGLVCWRGTTVHGLLRGVLLEPMQHANNYSYGVDWRPGTLAFAGISIGLAVVHRWLCGRAHFQIADGLIVGLRLVQLVAVLVAVALLMEARVIGAVFSWVAPSIWIWTVPLHTIDQPAAPRVRSLVATALLLQYLHAYPIGGIQESWGAFLFFPLVGLGLGEMRSWCTQTSRGPRWGSAWNAIAAIGVIVVAAKTAVVSRGVYQVHASRLDLNLPGASHLRLQEGQRTAFRILSLNAAVHSDLLFSLPGMFSFNLWTDLPTPTTKNTTVWFTLLSDAEQRAAMAALERSPRSCVIVQHDVLQVLRDAKIPVSGPLYDYLMQNYTPVFRVEGFGFMTRNGRAIAPLNVAEVAPLNNAASGGASHRLILRLAGNGTVIDAIEARTIATTPATIMTLGGRNSSATVTPIDANGRAIGESRRATWPLEIKGLTALTIEFDGKATPLPSTTTVFYLKDASGAIFGEARMSD